MSPDAAGGAAAPRGEIFDLGYRGYDGERLGRSYAIRSLIELSVRSAFGIGRDGITKAIAIVLALFAFVPALFAVATGAVGGSEFEIIKYEEYFGLIRIVLVLFVAATASELVGNDRKNGVLPLYFSRPIRRDDYVLAKIASLALSLLALTLLPLLLVFIGNWLGADDSTDFLLSNGGDLLRILFSSVLVCGQLAAVGLAIAMFTTTRGFALAAVIATLMFTLIAASILVGILDPGPGAVAMLLSPLAVIEAATLAVFDAIPPVTALSQTSENGADQIAYVGLWAPGWVLAALAQTAIAVGLAMRRYRRERV